MLLKANGVLFFVKIRRIEYFHASEAESLKKQFLGWTPKQRNQKIDRLIAVIQRHARQAISVRLKQKHYDQIIKGNVPPFWDNAYYFLFPAFVQAVIAMERHVGNGEQVSLVFDNSRFEKRSHQQYSQISDHPLFANCVVDISYEDDRDLVPLQAADLLAWQIRRAFSVVTEPRRNHYDQCRKCGWTFFDNVLSEKDLGRAFDVMEENARRCAAKMGVSIEQLQSWKRK